VVSGVSKPMAQHVISASQFKARCLALMDAVASGGEPLLITKNGKPVAELHPVRGRRAPMPWGIGAGGRITGDILAPALDEADWEALQP